ncbi:hypothetical protein AVEN_261339-1 [Araneus ventricosus]|uniref:Uncharacterized protein n=1 Tax=Araneus ventricosus TaxID=182803 RepID=A0A4Y2GY87_ARAVE|nr:hypothetical protein AVEN_261339-1 [Araneus ventricosus]
MPHPSILCLPGMLDGHLSYSPQSCPTCNVSQHLLAAIPAQSRSTTRGRLPPPEKGALRAECGTSSRTAYSGAFGEPDEVRHTRRKSKLNRPEEI